MIKFLQNKDIDKQKWDDTIAQCGNVYAYSWYLDIVHPGWNALVEDEYQAVMPLTGGKKFRVDYLFQPYFVQQLGVFSKQSLTSEKVQQFLRTIPQTYRFCEIRLNEGNLLAESIEGIAAHRNIILDLNRDYETLRANYHQNTKRNLAKAESHNLQIVETVIPYHVVALFRDNRGVDIEKWGDAEYNVMTQLATVAKQKGKSFVLGVTEKGVGELLCAAIFMNANGRITFLFSGLSPKGRDKQAMTYMMDQAIQRYAGHPVTFDFEGSDDDNLARFYLGFGGQEVVYPSYNYNHLSVLGRRLLKLWKKMK